jgi:hypothetical protein
MSERYWPGPALGTIALSLLTAATALVGCGSSARTGHASATKTAGVAADAARSAGSDASADSGDSSFSGSGSSGYNARQLDDALLPEVGGAGPADAIETGDYGSLPEVQTSKQTIPGVKVTPAVCAGTGATGFGSALFSPAPAAVVTFQVGPDGVFEVLVAATAPLAAQALSDTLPAGCAHYQAMVDGKTFSYSVRETVLPDVADQARAVNISATGYAEVNVWSVVFRGRGFVGSVTMVGPDVSGSGARHVAQDAYAYARRSLPQV